MMILTVGIDLAKNVFAVHGVNEAGKAELVRPAMPRDKLHARVRHQGAFLSTFAPAQPSKSMS